jgi:hypothetical protein
MLTNVPPVGNIRNLLGIGTVVLVGALTACGGSSVIVRTGPAGSTIHAPASSALTNTPDVSSTSSARPAPSPVITLRPSAGLSDGELVQVVGTGFSPNEALQVIECADKGTKTGPGDCDLGGILNATSDASGRVTAQLRVRRGPFGINKIVCDLPLRCLLSVTQASLSPTEEADAPITFGS